MKRRLRVLLLLSLWIVVSSAPIVVAQVHPLAALLAQDGWKAIAAGQAAAAAKIFQQAIAIDANNPELYLGAGTAAFVERRDEAAQVALERALQLNPALAPARELLGLVLYRRGDLFGAIRTYELIDRHQPNQQALERLERWRRELDLHNRMGTLVGSAFTVSFEGEQDADLAARVLESLERASSRISAALAYPVRPVPVVLYTGEQFHDITRSPSWAAGAYDGTIRIPIRGALEKPGELDRVIAHEFTHAVIRGIAPRDVPTWLNEGLATVLEREEGNGTIEQPSGSVPRLSALSASFGPMNAAEAKVANAVSARAAQWLLDNVGGFAIVNLLRDLGEDVPFERAFLNRMQRSFADFESSLIEGDPNPR